MILLNKLQILCFIGVMLLLNGCSKDDTPIFSTETFVNFEIPAGLNTIETHTFILEDVPLGIKSQLQAQSINEESIVRLLSSRGLVEARFDDIDWNFVFEVSVRVLDNADNTMSEEIFYQDPVPLDTNDEIRLFSNITNLKDILITDVATFEVKFRLRNFSPTNIDTRLTMSFVAFDSE